VTGSPYQLKRDPYSSHSVILSRLGEGRGRRALDVAAADGFLSELLTRQGWTVTALERDPQQAARARGRCKEVIVADLEDPQVEMGGPYDAIVCGDVLEHLREPLAALLALKSRLVPDGVIVVSVPNVAHLWMRLSLLAGRFDYSDRGLLDRTHLRFFTRRTLLDFLRAAGLRVTELTVTPAPLPLVVPERYHGGWLRIAHALNALTARCWKTGLAYQFVAVCRPAGGGR
jgi:2-polyprenyl-3-methyl-5-hydroxy-6-metoxy-1,4-benzoquinol methylase